VSLSNAGWADEYDILPIIDEAEVQQRINLAFSDRRLVSVIEVFQMFLQWQAHRLSSV